MRKLNGEAHWAYPYILRQFGPKAKDAVKPLVTHLDSPDDGIRLSAALALGEIGTDARDALPALMKSLKDKNPMVRQAAALSIGRISKDPHPDLRAQMQEAFEQIRKDLAEALQQYAALKRVLAVQQPGPRLFRPVNREALTN